MNAASLPEALNAALIFAGAAATSATFLLCLAALRFRRLAASWRGHEGRTARSQVQDIHDAPAPRLGGIMIVLTVAALLALDPARIGHNASLLLLAAAFPVLLLAAIDDLVCYVSARLRLAAALLSGALYVLVSGSSIDSVGIAPVDLVLSLSFASLALTAACVATTINAFNLIDGMNGLAASIFILTASVIGVAAHGAGQDHLLYLCVVMSCAVLGFLGWNFPGGNLFLGDVGAYLLGFAAAVLTVELYASSAALAAPNILLILFWPAFELLTTVVRRLAAGKPVFRPDRAHTHTLVFRLLRIRGLHAKAANNLAALACLGAAIPPAVVGGIVQPSAAYAWWACGGFFALYAALRAVSPRFARILARRARCVRVAARLGARPIAIDRAVSRPDYWKAAPLSRHRGSSLADDFRPGASEAQLPADVATAVLSRCSRSAPHQQ